MICCLFNLDLEHVAVQTRINCIVRHELANFPLGNFTLLISPFFAHGKKIVTMFASSMQNTSKLNPNAINLYYGSTVFAFIYILVVCKGKGWNLQNSFTLSSGPKLRVAYIFAYHKLESMFVFRYTRECG